MYRLRNLCRKVSEKDYFITRNNPMQGRPAWGIFMQKFFRTRKSGGMKLCGIIPVDSGTACNCSVIGDKDGFHAIGLFHQLHSLF